jgi:hypothetical protein
MSLLLAPVNRAVQLHQLTKRGVPLASFGKLHLWRLSERSFTSGAFFGKLRTRTTKAVRAVVVVEIAAFQKASPLAAF